MTMEEMKLSYKEEADRISERIKELSNALKENDGSISVSEYNWRIRNLEIMRSDLLYVYKQLDSYCKRRTEVT